MKKSVITTSSWMIFVIAFMGLNACKKTSHSADHSGKDSSTVMNWRDADSLKYYIWHINKSKKDKPIPYLKNAVYGWAPMYYWADKIPDDLDWSSEKYNGKTLAETGSNLLNDLASYSPKFNGVPEDRYSFIDVQGTVSQELQGGQKGDFGYMFGLARGPKGAIHMVIEYVYPGSPAADQGVKRGDEIIGINGNTDFNLESQSGVNQVVKAALQSNSVRLKLATPRDSAYTYTVNLDKSEYHLNPVLFHDIYEINGEKIGYFVYNAFVAIGQKGNGPLAKQEIDTVFSKFKAAGISELIVDLRYNGGGAVNSAEYLDDLIAPASAQDKEMYEYKYNDELTSFIKNQSAEVKNSFLAPIKFQAVDNNLDLKRVFFVGSRGTASAAELTINNLKPYMDVQLVGDTTYGKPVGFFTIPINFVTRNNGYQHVADMYAIDFKSVNSNGKSDYFGGLMPDFDFPGYLGFRWGKKDPVIQSIFSKIANGTYASEDQILRRQNATARKVGKKTNAMMRKSPSLKVSNPNQFNEMVDYKRSKELNFHLK